MSAADLARAASAHRPVSDASVRHLVNRTRSTFSDGVLYAVSVGLGWPADAIHRMIEGGDAPEPVAGDDVALAEGPDLDEVLRKVQEAMDAMTAFKRAHERKERR